jgi:hypothetical protein
MNPVKKTAKVVIGDKTYELVWDFNAIADAEEQLDTSLVMGLFDKKNLKKPPANLVRGMFYAAAKYANPELTYEEVKAIISDPISQVLAWGGVNAAWSISTAKAEDTEEPNPLQDQKQ